MRLCCTNRCLTVITLLPTSLNFLCRAQMISCNECQLSTSLGCCSEGTPCSFQSPGTGSYSSQNRLRYCAANEPSLISLECAPSLKGFWSCLDAHRQSSATAHSHALSHRGPFCSMMSTTLGVSGPTPGRGCPQIALAMVWGQHRAAVVGLNILC